MFVRDQSWKIHSSSCLWLQVRLVYKFDPISHLLNKLSLYFTGQILEWKENSTIFLQPMLFSLKAFWYFTTKKCAIYLIWSCEYTYILNLRYQLCNYFFKPISKLILPQFRRYWCRHTFGQERLVHNFSPSFCWKCLKNIFPLLVLRDIDERGRDLENVLFQYTNLVKPAFEEFCLPVSNYDFSSRSKLMKW